MAGGEVHIDDAHRWIAQHVGLEGVTLDTDPTDGTHWPKNLRMRPPLASVGIRALSDRPMQAALSPATPGSRELPGLFAVRLFLIAALALLCFSELGACAEYSDTPAPVHPDLIIVRRFATPRRIVTLDPSLGFSLHRGQSGVRQSPLRLKAAHRVPGWSRLVRYRPEGPSSFFHRERRFAASHAAAETAEALVGFPSPFCHRSIRYRDRNTLVVAAPP